MVSGNWLQVDDDDVEKESETQDSQAWEREYLIWARVFAQMNILDHAVDDVADLLAELFAKTTSQSRLL
jgi:hypothetical protein